jgi:thiamine-phosphate pyrophosphorylase
MRGLYAIVDVSVLRAKGLDPIEFARAALAVRPAALQLRAKELGARESLALLRALAPVCRGVGVPLVANDRPDLAVLAGCDMVHLGQDDVPPELARRIAPRLGIGISTHTPEQLARALDARPSYVAYGPIFATASKTNPEPVVGIAGLREAVRAAERAGIPIVAIGGIDLARAADVGRVAPCAAVIAGLVADVVDMVGVSERARAFAAALRSGASPAEVHA